MARASAFQAEGRGFESRFPLHVFSGNVLYRPCSSVVERFLGKEEAIGSIPIMGFTFDGPVCDRVNSAFSPGSFGLMAGVTFFWLIKMRDIVHLACEDCKRRNYSTTRNKKQSTQRLELKKYCRFCRKHTSHKEIK